MPLVNRNRRQGADMVVLSKRVFVLFGWIFMFAFFFAISLAMPRFTTMFDRFYGGNMLNGAWSKEFLKIAVYFMIPVAIASAVSLFLSRSRHKRKSDKYNVSSILFLVLSVVAIALFYIMR